MNAPAAHLIAARAGRERTHSRSDTRGLMLFSLTKITQVAAVLSLHC
jgi:hypothetical protein